MSDRLVWLPAIVTLSSCGGDWAAYEEAIFAIFKHDFVDTFPQYAGEPVRVTYHPSLNNKHFTFWHMICEGKIEEDRTPDMRRCERVPWPRPIIERCALPELLVWENTRKGNRRVCIWLVEEDYLVVLERRKGYLLLWTTYMIDWRHRRESLRREHDEYWAQKD